jgi:putative ABC transport system ATP-binding protein
MQELIKVSKEVNFTYPKELKYTYCVQSGLTISQEKMYSISGISGSGKSTILTLLAGLRRFKKGSIDYYFSSSKDKSSVPVSVNAENWSKVVGPRFWGNIGFSFQKPELIRALPVKMNLELALGKNTEKMALDLFEQNEWDQIRDSRTWEISGGQIQRLGIIRAFGQNQNLVFMDEPTNNLDKSNREKVVSFIQKYGKYKAIVLVSHDKLFLDMLNIEATFEIGEESESRGPVKRILRQVASPTISETVQSGTIQIEGDHYSIRSREKFSDHPNDHPDNKSPLPGKAKVF